MDEGGGEPNRGRRRALVGEPKQCRAAWGIAGSLVVPQHGRGSGQVSGRLTHTHSRTRSVPGSVMGTWKLWGKLAAARVIAGILPTFCRSP